MALEQRVARMEKQVKVADHRSAGIPACRIAGFQPAALRKIGSCKTVDGNPAVSGRFALSNLCRLESRRYGADWKVCTTRLIENPKESAGNT